MSSMNIFENDAFSLTALTAAIQKMPFQPGRIGASGLFSEQGVTTLSVFVEQYDDVLALVPVTSRGAPATPMGHGRRAVRSFKVPHIPARDVLNADEIMGVRARGSESEVESIVNVVGQRLQVMRNSIEYTIESHRLAAVKGVYFDAAGNQVSLFTEFGVVQQTVDMVLDDNATPVRTKCMDVLSRIEDALGGLSFSGVRVFCGKDFWTSLIEHKAVKETFLNTQMAVSLRGDPRVELNFGGITFERYRGTSAVKIADNEAFAVPEGVLDLFITRYAPADYVETVNTMGEAIYAKQWDMEGGKGVHLEAQSNPLSLCTRPAAVIKLTV